MKLKPAMCPAGNGFKNGPSFDRNGISHSLRIVLCECWTPFGRAVVPEVYSNTQRSSADCNAGTLCAAAESTDSMDLGESTDATDSADPAVATDSADSSIRVRQVTLRLKPRSP